MSSKDIQLHIYTDGSASKGAKTKDTADVKGEWLGIGAWCRHEGTEYELSSVCTKKVMAEYSIDGYTDVCSNPTAEFIAFAEALKQLLPITRSDLVVTFYIDYVGVAAWMSGEWQAKKEYITKIRDVCRKRIAALPFTIKYIHVKGHSGVEGNEKADKLAGSTAESNTFGKLVAILDKTSKAKVSKQLTQQSNISSHGTQTVKRPMITFYAPGADNYIFSNFYPQLPSKKFIGLELVYAGDPKHAHLTWPTSEHLYQALKFKAKTKAEKRWRNIIRTASTPGIARHLGHLLTRRRYKWEQDATDLVNEYKDQVRLAGDIYDETDGVCKDQIGSIFNEDTCFLLRIMRIAVQAKFDGCKPFRKALLATQGSSLMEDSKDRWGWEKGWLGKCLEDVRDEAASM